MSKGKSKRRISAKTRVNELRRLGCDVKLHDDKGQHITVTMQDRRRVEWWPGTGRWATGGPGTVADGRGSMDELMEWIAGQHHAA